MKKTILLLGLILVATVAWLAGRASQRADSATVSSPPRSPVENASTVASGRTGATPSPVSATTEVESPGSAESDPTGTIASSTEPPVPIEVAAPIATVVPGPVPTTVTSVPFSSTTVGAPAPPHGTEPQNAGSPRPLIVPVAGVPRSAMREMFNEVRGNRRHEAIDILAPRRTPVIATDDGVVKKLFTSVPGGLTIYQFDPDEKFCYYYAHLDGYASGLKEGQQLHRGDLVGYVGTTGNAPKDTPHLHFALIRLDPEKRWWKGTYVDPYPLLSGGQPR